MYYEEHDIQVEDELVALEEARDKDECLFDADEECAVHHSYLHADNVCLWKAQHPLPANPLDDPDEVV